MDSINILLKKLKFTLKSRFEKFYLIKKQLSPELNSFMIITFDLICFSSLPYNFKCFNDHLLNHPLCYQYHLHHHLFKPHLL